MIRSSLEGWKIGEFEYLDNKIRVESSWKAAEIAYNKIVRVQFQDETPVDSEQHFKTTVLYPLIDTIVNSLEKRFEQMSNLMLVGVSCMI